MCHDIRSPFKSDVEKQLLDYERRLGESSKAKIRVSEGLALLRAWRE